MIDWTIRQYYCSDWKVVFCWSGNSSLQDSPLHIEAAPEPLKVVSFKLVCLTWGEDKEHKLGLAILREHKQFGMSSVSRVAWSQYCCFSMHNANLLRKQVFLKYIFNMLRWALLTHYPQTYKEEVFLYPEEGAREGQMCSAISVSNPKARFLQSPFEIGLDALAWRP